MISAQTRRVCREGNRYALFRIMLQDEIHHGLEATDEGSEHFVEPGQNLAACGREDEACGG